MFLIKRIIIASLVFTLSLSLIASAQQATPRPAQATTPRPVKPKVAKVNPAPSTATTVAPTIAPATTVAPSVAPTPTAMSDEAAPVPVRPSQTPSVNVAPARATTPVANARPVVNAPSLELQQPQATTATAPTPPAREDYVSEKSFKGRVFEVKHRDPWTIVRAIQLLGSGFKGAQMSYSEEFKTITVRDFPENIAAIEEAIKRLDVPQAPRPDIEFRIQVLIASNTTLQDGVAAYPDDLKNLLTQLLATLKYTNYALMFSANHRAKEGGQGVMSNGVVEPKLFNVSIPPGNQIFYDYGMGVISLDSSTTAGPTVQIGTFNFSLRIPLSVGGTNAPIQYQNVGFRSPVSLREGEKVVVGTTTMGDKGLIVVLSAKVNK